MYKWSLSFYSYKKRATLRKSPPSRKLAGIGLKESFIECSGDLLWLPIISCLFLIGSGWPISRLPGHWKCRSRGRAHALCWVRCCGSSFAPHETLSCAKLQPWWTQSIARFGPSQKGKHISLKNTNQPDQLWKRTGKLKGSKVICMLFFSNIIEKHSA